MNVSLSVDDLMGCWVDKMYNHGCQGGVRECAWKKYLLSQGVVSENCFPFTTNNANGSTPNCSVSQGACAVTGEPYPTASTNRQRVARAFSFYGRRTDAEFHAPRI